MLLGFRQRDGKFREGKLYFVLVMHVELVHLMCVWVHVHVLGGRKCKYDNVHSCMDTCACVCSSTHSCGCMADGGDAMVVF